VIEIHRQSIASGSPHSHSIVLSHGNALNFQRKFFLCATKNRLTDPSENRALEFKGEFRRFGIRSVSATIANDWSIFLPTVGGRSVSSDSEKDRHDDIYHCSA
jgi:hypothetical protein